MTGVRWSGWLMLAVWLLGSGCSVQMAYNNLDRLARWSMSDYVAFSDAQRAYFDASLEQLWRWHRTSHLPQYAALLEELGPQLVDGTDEARMQALVERVFLWADDIERRALPIAAELLASLSDEQIAELADNLQASNEEIAEPERGRTVAQAQEQWRDEFGDRFSQFSGRLTQVQQTYLDGRAADYVPEAALWADYRRRWQGDFLALLAFRGDVDGLQRGLEQLSRHRELYYGAELAAADASNVALAREVSVWLINSLTRRQQERFVDRLGELAEDFRQLAAQDVGPVRDVPCLLRC